MPIHYNDGTLISWVHPTTSCMKAVTDEQKTNRICCILDPEGTQQSFIRGGSTLARFKPSPFYIPFFTEKVSLSYTAFTSLTDS